MIFREIEKEDDEAIAAIVRDNLKKAHLDIPGTAYFDECLDHLSEYYLGKDGRYYCILTDDAGKVCGGVGLGEFPYIRDCAEMQKLYLSDEVKGRGLGRKLTELIQDQAFARGYKKMYLETHSNLDTAIKLYTKLGFESIDRPDFVKHTTMDTFFIKELEEKTMNEEFEEYVTFTVEAKDGTEVEMAAVDEFEFEKTSYVVGAKIEGDTINEEGLYIFKGKVVDEELKVEKITDPKEYEKVSKAYLEL